MANSEEAAERADAGGGGGPPPQPTGLPPEPDSQMREAAELRRKTADALAKLLSLDGVITGRLDSVSYGCFIRASELAAQFVHGTVGVPHLVAAFASDKNGRRVLEDFGFKPDGVLKLSIAALADAPRWLADAPEHHEPHYAEGIQVWVKAAADYASQTRSPENRTIEAGYFFSVLSGRVSDPRLIPILKLLRGEPDPTLRTLVEFGLKRLEIVHDNASFAGTQIARHRRVSRRRARRLERTIVGAIVGLRPAFHGIEATVSRIEASLLRSGSAPISLVASVLTVAVLVGSLAGWLLRP